MTESDKDTDAIWRQATSECFAEIIAQNKQLKKEIAAIRDAGNLLGQWLSAALDDPNVCPEMKRHIEAWFDALEPTKESSQ